MLRCFNALHGSVRPAAAKVSLIGPPDLERMKVIDGVAALSAIGSGEGFVSSDY